MKVLSGLLILLTVFLNLRHGWSGITMSMKPEEASLFNNLGLSRSVLILVSALTLLGGILVLIPQTFFAANLLNAAIILFLMAFLLKAGNLKAALIEIPFLLMPLLLIWLGHPFKK